MSAGVVMIYDLSRHFSHLIDIIRIYLGNERPGCVVSEFAIMGLTNHIGV